MQLREEKGMSQRKLADASGVNRSTLRRIEEGKARGEIDVIERLLGQLDYELEIMHFDAIEEANRRVAEMDTDPIKRSQAAMSRLMQLTARAKFPVFAF